MTSVRSGIVSLIVAALALGSLLGSTQVSAGGARSDAPRVLPAGPPAPGVQRLQLEAGPFDIRPGQNSISNAGLIQKPQEPGYVVGIKPDIRYADGTVPAVDVIHLHHGVWFNASRNLESFLAVGEEKTALRIPPGYGYPFEPDDRWTINYMIHDLTPAPADIWITYEIDFLPATAPAARDIVPVRPIYLDVQNGGTTFDVLRGSGKNGTFTYPDQADDPYRGGPPKNEYRIEQDGVLVHTAGHLHPGGLRDNFWLDRPDPTSGPSSKRVRTAHLFESEAHYYEPAGAVSWDVSMTATRPDWRVGVRTGDVLRITSTYETERASWYQSMGLAILWMANGGSGPDPFTTKVDRRGYLTHGRLPENRNHGGKRVTLRNATKFPSKAQRSPIPIDDFFYAVGDMTGKRTIPRVSPGRALQFVNKDAPKENGIWHTITACRAPCNRETGVAYPLADGEIDFDSGELGLGGWPTANRVSWSTPKDLPGGKYTYFCRVHPFMRGAFEVAPDD